MKTKVNVHLVYNTRNGKVIHLQLMKLLILKLLQHLQKKKIKIVRRNKKKNMNMDVKKVWQCNEAIINGKKACSNSLAVNEEYIEAINKLVDEDKTKSINEFLDIVEQTIISKSSDNAINALKAEIEALENKKDNVLDLRVSGIISKKDCERKYANINQELEIKKSQLEE